MSIETRPCVTCGYTLLIIDSETQPCINCNTEREFKRVMDPIDSQLCTDCNGEY